MAKIVRITFAGLTSVDAEMGDLVRTRGIAGTVDMVHIPFGLADGTRVDIQLTPDEARQIFVPLNDALLPA